MSEKNRKLVLNISEHTFQYLEVLAFGLNCEKYPNDRKNEALTKGFNKKDDHFAPLVSRLLEDVAASLATGTRRPGSWERDVISSLTGWEGTVNKGMFGNLVELPDPKYIVANHKG